MTKATLLLFVVVQLLCGELFSQSQSHDSRGNLRVYDENSNLIEYHYLDSEGALRKDNNVSIKKIKYDSLNNITERACYRYDSTLFQMENGVAKEKFSWSYLSNGAKLIIEYYDMLDQPTYNKENGAHKVLVLYDSLNRYKEARFFDLQNILINDQKNSAIIKYEYEGSLINEYHYDKNGELVKIVNDKSRYLASIELDFQTLPRWIVKNTYCLNEIKGLERDGKVPYHCYLRNSNFVGKAIFDFTTNDDLEIINIELTDSLAVDKNYIRKLNRALEKARFKSLTQFKNEAVSGTLIIHFLVGSFDDADG